MSGVLLFHFESDFIKVTIEAYFNGESLVVEGYDIGKRVEEAWGDSDYEYSVTVHPPEVEKLYPLMGVENGDKEKLLLAIAQKFNTNTCFSEFRDFLDKNGVKSEGFSWT